MPKKRPPAAATRTTQLDLRTESSTENAQEGWAWNSETRTLTLTNVNFDIAASIGLRLPSNSTIICTEGSENNIKNAGSSGNLEILNADHDPTDELTIKGNGTLNLISPDVTGANDDWTESTGVRAQNVTINKTKVNVLMGNNTNTSNMPTAEAQIYGLRIDELTLKGGANLNISVGVATANGSTFGDGAALDRVNLYGGKLDISSASENKSLLPHSSKVIDYKDATIKDDSTSVDIPSVTYENEAILIETSGYCEVVGDKVYTPVGCGNDVYVSDTSTVTVQKKNLPNGQIVKDLTITANGIAQTETSMFFSLTVQKDINYVITAKVVPGFAVRFQTNGGSNIADINLETDAKIAVPTAPTKDGFVFGGWFKDAELTTPWNFENNTVTEETTLYAKWNVVPGGDSDGGSGLSTGAIIGIVSGGVVALLLVAYEVLFFVFYRKNKLSGKFWNTLFVPMNKLFAKRI